jgi:Tfp pilus assembly protein PilF
MTGMSKTWMSAVLLAALVAGCQESGKNDAGAVGIVNSEQRKAELLRQIQRKYESPRAHYELARIYHTDGMWLKAEMEYRTAVGFDPMLWDAEAGLVKMFMDSGNEAKSRSVAENAIDRAKFSADMSLQSAKAFQKEYLDEYALRCHNQALALAPNSAAVYKHIGYYYLSKHDIGRAEANLRQSFQLDPYQPEVAGELGRMGIIVEVPGVNVKPDVESTIPPDAANSDGSEK